jgi:stringent starvation protein B
MTKSPPLSGFTATSTTPYFLRALYEWCSDNRLTPYVVIDAHTPGVQVPREAIRDGHIVLNISLEATSGLEISNELIEFKTRFSGIARQVCLPINSVRALYASETGQGMSFDPVDTAENQPSTASSTRQKNSARTATPLSGSSPSKTESASSPSASHSSHAHLSLVASQAEKTEPVKAERTEPHDHVLEPQKPDLSNPVKKPTLTLVK